MTRGLRHGRLVAATETLHRAVEAQIERSGAFADRAGYAGYVVGMHLFHDRLEREARRARAGEALRRWGLAGSAARLARDLAALEAAGVSRQDLAATAGIEAAAPGPAEGRSGLAGFGPGSAVAGARPPALSDRNLPMPDLADPDVRLGALYVLVGSMLGARVLVRRAAALGIGPETGGGHLAAFAAADPWRRFLIHLETAPVADEAVVVAGARACFAAIGAHLARAPGLPPTWGSRASPDQMESSDRSGIAPESIA